jgi:hypothetical protein
MKGSKIVPIVRKHFNFDGEAAIGILGTSSAVPESERTGPPVSGRPHSTVPGGTPGARARRARAVRVMTWCRRKLRETRTVPYSAELGSHCTVRRSSRGLRLRLLSPGRGHHASEKGCASRLTRRERRPALMVTGRADSDMSLERRPTATISKPSYYYGTIIRYYFSVIQPVPKADRKCCVKCKMKGSHLKSTQKML